MQKYRFLLVPVIILVLILSLTSNMNIAMADNPPPPLPSSFYGEIQLISSPPSPGIDYVEVHIEGITGYVVRDLVETYQTDKLVYALSIPGDNLGTAGKDGGIENDVVTFKIGDRIVAKSIWHSGTNVILNLHPPQPNSNGPYVGVTGEPVNLNATISDAFSMDEYTFAWDLDDDGSYDDAIVQNPTYSFSQGPRTVKIKVTDSQGGEGVASGTVFVITPINLTGLVYDGTQKEVLADGAPFGYSVTYNGSATKPRNAGNYTVVISICADSGCSTYAGTITKTMVINPRPITVTAATSTKVYDGTTSSSEVPTVTSGNVVGGDSGAWTQTFDNKNAGTGKVLTPAGSVSDGNGGNNYTVTFAPATGSITKRLITVTAATSTKVYDGTTSSSGVPTVTSGNVVSGDSAIWSQTFNTKHVGTGKTLTPAGTITDGNDGNNYNVTYTTTTGSITKRLITVTAATSTKVYDGTTSSSGVPLITVGTLGVGDTANWTQTYNNKNVGTGKTLTPSGVVNDGNSGNNYTLTFIANNTGVITVKPVTVTADAKTKPYGAIDPTLTYQVTSGGPLASGDTFSGALTRQSGEAVGSYPILQGTLALSSNYTLTYVGASLTITASSVTVNVTPGQSKVYGSADPGFTYTSNPTGVTFTGALSRTSGESVGTYAINQGTLANANYTINFVPANFTINKKAASVTPNAASKIYGSIDPALTGTLTGFLPADGVTGTYSRTPGETVSGGPYTMSATLSPSTGVLNNYDITYNTANFTITKKAASVTPNAASKFIDEPDPALGGTLSGFLAGDNVMAVYSRVDGEAVGTYTITATLSPAGVLGNYNITYNTALFTIKPLHKIQLKTGWNLVSFNLVPADPSTAVVLSSVATHYDLVFAWDASVTSGNWKTYDPANPNPNQPLAQLTNGMGFWIHMTADDTLEVAGTIPTSTNISLLTAAPGGWNLVGFPSAGSGALPAVLTDNGVSETAYSMVYAFHTAETPQWLLYDRAAAPYANKLTTVTPGWGYWVKVNTADTWEVGYNTP